MEVMFYVSSFLALASIGMLVKLKETVENPQRFHPRLMKLNRDEIIEPKALPVAFVCAFVYLTFGILLTISPDQATYVGMENKGLLFTSFTVFTLISRATAGRVSDKYGRLIVIKVSIILVVLSLIFAGMVHDVTTLMLAAGALGFSTGIAAPAVFAWVIDISPDDRRGRYMATVYIALEVGIGFGALFSAWVYDNNPDNFGKAYFISAGLTAIAWVYLQFFYREERQE